MTDDELRQLFAKIDARFDQIDGRFEQIDSRFEQIDSRFEQIDSRFEQSDSRYEQSNSRFEQIDSRFEEMQRRNDEAHAETRRHFDVAQEAMHGQIQLLAEKVTMVDDRLTREAADIRTEMRQGFAETHALIKFSYNDLDRRVRTLEDSGR